MTSEAGAKATDGLRRRALIAGAAALAATLVAREIADHTPVSANDGTWSLPYTGTASGANGDNALVSFKATDAGVVGLYATSNGGDSVYGNSSGGGYGVRGVSVSGNGVSGFSTSAYGVYGRSSGNHAVFGEIVGTTANTAGVFGVGNNTGTFGVYGYGLGAAVGVAGISSYAPGVAGTGVASTGVQGSSTRGYGVVGTTASGGYAVYGRAAQNVGVGGISDGGPYPYGVVGQVNVSGGFALFGSASLDNSVAFGGTAYGNAVAGQFIGPVNVYGQIVLQQQTQPPSGTVNAFIVGPGVTKNAAVELPDGTHGLMHCVEAPEPWFEDFGQGTITAGKAEVKLDAAFVHTVNTDTLHVFLTAHDGDHALHIAGKNAGGFSVGAVPSGPATAAGKRASDLSGTFTWRVVAKRRDVKGDRLQRVVLPKAIEAKVPPQPPLPPTLPVPPIAKPKP